MTYTLIDAPARMSLKLEQAHSSVKHARGLLKEALHDAGAMEALFIMQLLESSQRLLYDLEALQSAVRADNSDKGQP